MAPTELLAEQHCEDLGAAVRSSPVPGVAAQLVAAGGRAPGGARRSRRWPRAPGGRHPRADPGPSELSRARPGRGRRAASLRRRAASEPGRQGTRAAPAGHDRNPDPALAGADPVRRPRPVGHRRAAAGPDAGDHGHPAGVGGPEDLRVPARRAGGGGPRFPGLPDDRWGRGPRAAGARAARGRGRGGAAGGGAGRGARPDGAGRARGSDRALPARRGAGAADHDRGRGRDRRPRGLGGGRRGRRALRPLPAPPAAGAGWPWCASLLVHPGRR